jgi:hypothetical protein
MDKKPIFNNFKSLILACFIVILFTAHTTTTSLTSDRITFCAKYIVWSDFYKGWFEDEHCR